jgi:hypothetical protein
METRTGPLSSRRLRFLEFLDIQHMKVPTDRLHHPGDTPYKTTRKVELCVVKKVTLLQATKGLEGE